MIHKYFIAVDASLIEIGEGSIVVGEYTSLGLLIHKSVTATNPFQICQRFKELYYEFDNSAVITCGGMSSRISNSINKIISIKNEEDRSKNHS